MRGGPIRQRHASRETACSLRRSNFRCEVPPGLGPCRCLQNLAKLLQALSAAESAYVAAMWSAAKMCIVCEGDDEQMRSAAASLCRLPSVISQAHRWGWADNVNTHGCGVL